MSITLKKYFYLILIFIFFGCTAPPPKEPPSYEQLNKIRTAMGYEAEDRWANWEVKWNVNDGGYIQYRVALYPISNDIAINGYLELIKDLSYKYAPEHDMFIILSKMGESVRREWYLSKK